MKNIFKKIIVTVLQFEAKLVLKKYRPKIVAITGSVGKTSTKDAVYSVLATSFFVRKSSKSFNSELGVPLTILGLPNAWNNPLKWLKNIIDGLKIILFTHPYPEWLVIEVGADRPGDIKSVAFWLKPDISIVTRLSSVPVHVEFFDSPEQVREEKSQLIRATKENGVAILNADDILVSTMRPLARGRVLTFGAEKKADVSAKDFQIMYSGDQPAGISFSVEDNWVKISDSVGRQHMYTALAGLAVAKALGLDLARAVSAFDEHVSSLGRMRILKGKNDSSIIDDTYNSSPVAAHEALRTLKEIKTTGRKIAVLGDMLELGEFSSKEHGKLGIEAAKVADVIFAVGIRAKGIYDSAIKSGFPQERIFYFSSSTDAVGDIKEMIQANDVVLVKGSQGVRMEKIVKEIMLEQEKSAELLVRQEPEWLRR